MVSLGTGEFRRPIKYDDAVNWGQLEWAQPIIGIVLQGSNSTVDYQLQQLLRIRAARSSPTFASRSSSARTPASTTPATPT